MTPQEALPRIVRALGGRPSGRNFACHCPVHSDRHPSLSVGLGRHGTILVCCYAGCESSLIIANLKARGLWPDECAGADENARALADADAYQRQRLAEAYAIWHETVPLAGTPGAHYLRHWRAITVDLSPRIRWHWRRFALVAIITDPLSDEARGVQITPLDRLTDRRGGGVSCFIGNWTQPETWLLKRRPDPGPRLFIGRTGVIRLLDGPGEIVVGEGVETTLSGAAIVGARAAWCALSAPGIASLRLPASFREVGLLVDCDTAGETACRRAAKRLMRADPRLAVRFLRPASPHNDFNDVQRAQRGA